MCLKRGDDYTDLATAGTQQIIATGTHTSAYYSKLCIAVITLHTIVDFWITLCHLCTYLLHHAADGHVQIKFSGPKLCGGGKSHVTINMVCGIHGPVATS